MLETYKVKSLQESKNKTESLDDFKKLLNILGLDGEDGRSENLWGQGGWGKHNIKLQETFESYIQIQEKISSLVHIAEYLGTVIDHHA